MDQFKEDIYLFIIPGIIGNVIHMIIVKKNLFSFFAHPVSSELFGENKTLRGFVFLPLLIGLFCFVDSILLGPFSMNYITDLLIGVGLGLSYMLAELPNSFIKRRIGIAPGKTSNKFRSLQLIIDKTDSLIGACIFYLFAMNRSYHEILLLFLVSFILHVSISYFLVLMKFKKSI